MEDRVIGLLRLVSEFPLEHSAKLICQLFEREEPTLIKQARAEVAREIFEDLRKTLSKVDDNNYEIHRGDLEYLQSKYMEGK